MLVLINVATVQMQIHAIHALKVLYYQMDLVLLFVPMEPMLIMVFVILATLHANCALITLPILASVVVMDI